MPPYGTIGPQAVSKEIHDVRGTKVRGMDGTKRDVADVIFDHRTMKIHRFVTDSGGWLAALTIATLGRSALARKPKSMIVRCNTSSANVSHPSFVGPYCRSFNG
jgi:hypothetical protein